MAYRFKKNYSVNGWYEECVYDHAPDVASYTRDVLMSFKSGEILEASPIKNSKMLLDSLQVVNATVFRFHESPYGVSMHGSSAYVKLPVEHLLSEGFIEEIPDEVAEKLLIRTELQQEYFKASHRTQEFQDIIRSQLSRADGENFDVDEGDFGRLTQLIIDEIHIWGEYILASHF